MIDDEGMGKFEKGKVPGLFAESRLYVNSPEFESCAVWTSACWSTSIPRGMDRITQLQDAIDQVHYQSQTPSLL